MFTALQILLEGEISPEGENIIPKWIQDDSWIAFFQCTFPDDNQFSMWAHCFSNDCEASSLCTCFKTGSIGQSCPSVLLPEMLSLNHWV